MPRIRGVYRVHPNTGVAGFWVELSGDAPGTLTGVAAALMPIKQQNETTPEYEVRVAGALMAVFESESTIPPSDPDYKNPPKGCRVANGKLIVSPISIAVTVITLSPLDLLITVE